jgi:hypothetical protein
MSNGDDFNQVFDDKTLNRFLRELMPQASARFIRNMDPDKREDIRSYFRDTLFREGLSEEQMLANWNDAIREAREVQSEPVKQAPVMPRDRDRFITPRLGYFPDSSKSFRLSDPPLVERIKRGASENKNTLIAIASFALLAGLAGVTSSAVLQSKYQNTLAEWNQQFGDMVDPDPGPDKDDAIPYYNMDSVNAIASTFRDLKKAIVDYDIPGKFKGMREEVTLNKKKEERDKIVNDTITNYYSNNTKTNPDWLFIDNLQIIPGTTRVDAMSSASQDTLALQRQALLAKKILSDRSNQIIKRKSVTDEVDRLVDVGRNVASTVAEDVTGAGTVTGALTGLVTGLIGTSSAVRTAIKIGEKSAGVIDQTLQSMNKKQKIRDETARDQFQGERHVTVTLSDGSRGTANYMGSGTDIVERIRRGDPPRTPVDRAAMAHDLRYALARNTDDLRKADIKMVQEIDKLSDTPMNVFTGKKTIQAKMKAEDLGLISKQKFATKDFAPPSGDDAKLLQEALNSYEQQQVMPVQSPVTQTQPVTQQPIQQPTTVTQQPIQQPATVTQQPIQQPTTVTQEPVRQEPDSIGEVQVQPVTLKPAIQQQLMYSDLITITSEPAVPRPRHTSLPILASSPGVSIPKKVRGGIQPVVAQWPSHPSLLISKN